MSSQSESFSALSNSDPGNSAMAMSPVTHLTHILCGLSTTVPRTPSGQSPKNWFAKTRRSSAVSIHSSLLTDDEIDAGGDTMFAVDKFLEDEESSEMSKSMSQIPTDPLSINSGPIFLKYRMATSEPRKAGGSELPVRRCLYMSYTSTPVPSRSPIAAETEGGASKFEEKKSDKFVPKRVKSRDIGIKCLVSKRQRTLEIIPQDCLPEPWSTIYSESGALIMKSVLGTAILPEPIGDFSKFFSLPLVHGRHADLKAINGETLARLLSGEFREFVRDYLVVDCRYPYEYDGGHIIGANNIYTKDALYNTLLRGTGLSFEMPHGGIIVFHCEFSQKRAPELLRFLREKDRELNKDAYPRLYYPEIYLLEGGYKAFYAQFKGFCVPEAYKPMLHDGHAEELQEYERKMRRACRKSSWKYLI